MLRIIIPNHRQPIVRPIHKFPLKAPTAPPSAVLNRAQTQTQSYNLLSRPCRTSNTPRFRELSTMAANTNAKDQEIRVISTEDACPGTSPLSTVRLHMIWIFAIET